MEDEAGRGSNEDAQWFGILLPEWVTVQMGEPSSRLIYTCVCVLGKRKEAEGGTVSCVWCLTGRSGSSRKNTFHWKTANVYILLSDAFKWLFWHAYWDWSVKQCSDLAAWFPNILFLIKYMKSVFCPVLDTISMQGICLLLLSPVSGKYDATPPAGWHLVIVCFLL